MAKKLGLEFRGGLVGLLALLFFLFLPQPFISPRKAVGGLSSMGDEVGDVASNMSLTVAPLATVLLSELSEECQPGSHHT